MFVCKKDQIHYARGQMMLIQSAPENVDYKKGRVFYAMGQMVLRRVRIE